MAAWHWEGQVAGVDIAIPLGDGGDGCKTRGWNIQIDKLLVPTPPPPQGKKPVQDWLLAKLLQYLKRRYEEGKSGKKTYVPTMHVAMTQD